LDYQIKDGGLLDSWLFFPANCSLSEWVGGNEVKATKGASLLLVDCPDIHLQAKTIYQTLKKELVLTLKGAVESGK
jgi:hypothetical protein